MSLFTISVNLTPRSASLERPALRVGEGWEDVGLSDASRPQGEPQAPIWSSVLETPTQACGHPGPWNQVT